MKLSDVLIEALKPSQYRAMVKGWDRDNYKDLFKKYTDDPKAYRIYLPIHAEKRVLHAPHEIIEAVREAGYEIEDYLAGIASKDDGKRKIKIGKLLKDPALQKLFANDPHRAASKSVEYYVVISRHPYDIAGMSTDRGWTSCMNLHSGINKHYVPLDVKNGTLVAYVIKSDDKNIANPSGRVLIKPFHDLTSKHADPALGVEDRVYGTDVPGFRDTVAKWADEVNESRNLNGIFILHPSLYSDGSSKSKLVGKDHTDEARVEHDPQYIEKFDNPSESLIRAAVKVPDNLPLDRFHSGWSNLRFIKHIPERLIREFIRKGGARVLQYMKCPIDEKLIMEFFKDDPMIIDKIPNPAPEIAKTAIDHFAKSMEYYGIRSLHYDRGLSVDIALYALKKSINFLAYMANLDGGGADILENQEIHNYVISHQIDPNYHGIRYLKKLSLASLEKLEKINYKSLSHVDWSSTNTNKKVKELVERVAVNHPEMIRELPVSLISKETLLAAIKERPERLTLMNTKLQREVINRDPEMIQYINTRGQSKMTKIATELSWFAIRHDPLLIKYVELPTKEMAEYAILQNPDAIHHVATRFWTIHSVATALHRDSKLKDYIVAGLKKSRFYNKWWPEVEDELQHFKDLRKGR